jgi:transposase-like protein
MKPLLRYGGEWRYWYGAESKHSQTIDLSLTARRDQDAALRLLEKAIRLHDFPEAITIDSSGADEADMKRDHQGHGPAIAESPE